MSLSQLKYERIISVAPLGLRFWDMAMHAPVKSGLIVTAHLPNKPHVSARATSNSSGVYGFIHLPGLRAFENGLGDASFWGALRPPREYLISVLDTQGRFHAANFVARAPVRGISGFDCTLSSPITPISSPPSSDLSVLSVPLFALSARAMPSTMAVIRADLRDVDSGRPAAWAMLEAIHDGTAIAQGVADADGKVAIFFPYPLLEPFSPPTRRSLPKQTWTIQLRVHFSRLPSQPVPELCRVLNQGVDTLLSDASSLTTLPDLCLEFGRDLVVQSQGRSELLVRPSP